MKIEDLRRRFGFLLGDVARLYGNKIDQKLRRLGMTKAQCRVMAHLLLHEGINQAGLAELLEIEPISLVRMLDRMEEAGWVERRPDPNDRRARCLYLTEKAQPVFDQVIEVADAHEAEVCADLSPEEKRSFIDMLLRLHTKLTERDALVAVEQDQPPSRSK
jgi:MarR family transcriptional regulator for hemolysin